MKNSNWKIKKGPSNMIYLYCNAKTMVWSMKIDEIHQYLKEFVKPEDVITYSGFEKEERKIKGKKLLEVLNE